MRSYLLVAMEYGVNSLSRATNTSVKYCAFGKLLRGNILHGRHSSQLQMSKIDSLKNSEETAGTFARFGFTKVTKILGLENGLVLGARPRNVVHRVVSVVSVMGQGHEMVS